MTGKKSSDNNVDPDAIIRVKTKHQVRYRKKRSQWPTVLGLLGLTAFVAVFGGVVHHVRQKQSETVALQAENEIPAQPTPRSRPAPRAQTPDRRPVADAGESTVEIPVSGADDSSLKMVPTELDPAPVDPIRQLLETLSQSGKQCETFQFLPENQSQYQQLQTFALQLSLAKTLLADDQAGEIDSEDHKSLTEQSVHWQQTMRELVTQVATDASERVPRINAFAKRQFEEGNSSDEANSQIVFYGFVFLTGNQEPNSILKFDRKQVYFSVPNVADSDQTSGDSYRVYFVETPGAPNRKRMHSPGGGLIEVSTAKVVYAFEPVGSED
jgi:hypothetical protein